MPGSRVTIYAGLLSGGGAMLWTLFEYAMGWHNEHLEIGARTGFVAIIFPILGIVWALREVRREAGGMLKMRPALAAGFMVSAISAAIGLIFFAAYFVLINPEFLAAMRSRGQAVDITSQLAAVVAGSLVGGMLITLVTALVMRKGATAQ